LPAPKRWKRALRKTARGPRGWRDGGYVLGQPRPKGDDRPDGPKRGWVRTRRDQGTNAPPLVRARGCVRARVGFSRVVTGLSGCSSLNPVRRHRLSTRPFGSVSRSFLGGFRGVSGRTPQLRAGLCKPLKSNGSGSRSSRLLATPVSLGAPPNPDFLASS
jgi:hypothetical protein